MEIAAFESLVCSRDEMHRMGLEEAALQESGLPCCFLFCTFPCAWKLLFSCLLAVPLVLPTANPGWVSASISWSLEQSIAQGRYGEDSAPFVGTGWTNLRDHPKSVYSSDIDPFLLLHLQSIRGMPSLTCEQSQELILLLKGREENLNPQAAGQQGDEVDSGDSSIRPPA